MMAHQPIAVGGNWNVWTLPWYLALHPTCPLMLVPVTARQWIQVPAFLVLHLLAAESQMTLIDSVKLAGWGIFSQICFLKFCHSQTDSGARS